jgi:hypothetical protein
MHWRKDSLYKNMVQGKLNFHLQKTEKATAVESNMEVHQKTENRTIMRSRETTPGHIPKGMCSRIQ